MIKLNVGSGFVKGSMFAKDWINIDNGWEDKPQWSDVDYLKFDIRNKWPLENDYADCMYASHILEHVEYKDLLHISKEFIRVLKSGQPVRIICPDPRLFIRNWQAKNMHYLKECFGEDNYKKYDYDNNVNAGFTDMFFEGAYAHVLCPPIDLIMIMLMKAGFSKVTEMSYTSTNFPELFGTGQPDNWGDSVDNRPVLSYYVEAVR